MEKEKDDVVRQKESLKVSASVQTPYDEFRILGRVLKVALEWLCAFTKQLLQLISMPSVKANFETKNSLDN